MPYFTGINKMITSVWMLLIAVCIASQIEVYDQRTNLFKDLVSGRLGELTLRGRIDLDNLVFVPASQQSALVQAKDNQTVYHAITIKGVGLETKRVAILEAGEYCSDNSNWIISIHQKDDGKVYHADVKYPCPTANIEMSSENVKVRVHQAHNGPLPRLETKRLIVDQEGNVRQPAVDDQNQQEDKTFLQKYWMYILGLGFFLLLR
ncbi:hypothetical protein MIR68_001235 [Amoeboaphelidium protococcarum]|nr:hypothetical protein MIR68_001235 [Amoeboaphelidium protococcarum]